jgi:hypothetical protein
VTVAAVTHCLQTYYPARAASLVISLVPVVYHRFYVSLYIYRQQNIEQAAEVIQNHENENVSYIGQGEARYRKCKRLKLGGGHMYDYSSD